MLNNRCTPCPMILAILIVAILAVATIRHAHAATPCVVNIPVGCEMIGSEYSTGGGDKLMRILEVDYKMPDGHVSKYMDSKATMSGFFGVGRFSLPERIDFVPWNQDHIAMGAGC